MNMSMDQNTINRLIEARRCMEIPKKESPKNESLKSLENVTVQEAKK